MDNNIAEAKRYILNAKEILSEKAKKEDGLFQDKKYVKLAGHAAYSGILIALDSIIKEKQKGRKSAKWYKEQLSKMDKKTAGMFDAAYDTLHLSLGYDGNPSAKIAKTGLEYAEQIIKWAEQKTN